jgi:hypothetical protein
MQRIKEYADEMLEELCGAKKYAEKYLLFKVNGDNTWASRYREMANDEIKHATWLHELSTIEIDKLRTIYTPPVDMQEKWDKSHARFVEKLAWIKQMLDM